MWKEVRLENGKVFCETCGRDVPVKEKPGAQDEARLPYVLVDKSGHVIAERTKEEAWRTAV
jgi:uncharacterized Zn finger protein (UPF0148 family)